MYLTKNWIAWIASVDFYVDKRKKIKAEESARDILIGACGPRVVDTNNVSIYICIYMYEYSQQHKSKESWTCMISWTSFLSCSDMHWGSYAEIS